jgi:hypothetical protein
MRVLNERGEKQGIYLHLYLNEVSLVNNYYVEVHSIDQHNYDI